MNTRLSLLAILLLVSVCASVSVCAQTADVFVVQCPDEFNWRNSAVSNDGGFLLSGYNGGSNSRTAMLLTCDTQGNLLWAYEQSDPDDSPLFRDADYLDDGTIIVLRNLPKFEGFTVQLIKDDQVIGQTESTNNGLKLVSLSDGFLLYYKPDRYSAVIVKKDKECKTVWSKAWGEPLNLVDILTKDGTHVAFGKVYDELSGSDPKGVIIALDDLGNTLWRYDGKSNETFSCAVWASDQGIVAAGRNGVPGECFIAKYTSDGPDWHTTFNYINEDNHAMPIAVKAIIDVEDGYLVACQVARMPYHVRMLRFDTYGSLISEWNEYIGEMGSIQEAALHRVKDKIYLLSHGWVLPPDYDLTDEDSGMTRIVTTLKEIDTRR